MKPEVALGAGEPEHTMTVRDPIEQEIGGAGGARQDTTTDVPVERASVFRNMANMASSQVVSWVLGLVAQIVQPRFLGPEGIGRIQLAFSVWMIAQVFTTMGTSAYLTLEMARDRGRAMRLIGPILLLRLATFAVGAVVVFLYASAAGYGSQMFVLLAITGSSILVTNVADTLTSAFIGMEQMAYPARSAIVAKVVYTAVMVVVLTMGGGVVGLAIATTFNAVLTLAMLCYFFRRFGRVTFEHPAGGFLAIIRPSLGFMVAGAVIVVYLQIDMVALSLLVEDEALGWYTTADVLASSMLFIPSMMISVLFPVIGRLHADDTEAAAQVIRRALSVLWLAGVAIGFGTTAIAEPFAVLLYGEEFRRSGQVLAVLGLMFPFIFGTIMLGMVAQATGRKRFWVTLMATAIVISVCFDIVFVPVMDDVAGNGAIAGALGYLVTEAYMFFVAIRRMAPRTFQRASLVRLAKTVVAGGLMVLAAWPLREWFILLPVAAGAVVFVLAVLVLGVLTDEEREMVRRVGARIGIGTAAPEAPTTGP